MMGNRILDFVNYSLYFYGMKVALFIPCYVDALYPDVGVASWKLLRHLGVDVSYPKNQTCCGQPMANGGFEQKAVPLAQKFEERFKGYDYVVAPSVSCTSFVREHYPSLLGEGHICEAAGHTVEMVTFLHDILQIHEPLGHFPYKVSLHNSCHGVRVLGLSSPREHHEKPFNKMADLLSLVDGIEVVEPERKDECCGFGGLFMLEFQNKYSAVIEDLFGKIADSDDTQLNARRQSELQKNIERYTDFRTYLKFDLETTDREGNKQLLSQTLNKKSGGETQTPFYIAVLASFAQLYQVNNRTPSMSNTVRLVIFDEAFNKMDSDRIVESVRLLRKMNLQAIVCTPPDKISDIMPIADKTLLVHKEKNTMRVLPFSKESADRWNGV